MTAYVVRETRPGIDVRHDEGLLNYIRESGQTSFHRLGTRRMGDDTLAVVDASLRVRGVTGLRVVDSSVMPAGEITHTSVPCSCEKLPCWGPRFSLLVLLRFSGT